MRPVKLLDKTWVDLDSVVAVSEVLAMQGNQWIGLSEARHNATYPNHTYAVQLTQHFRDKPFEIQWDDWGRYPSIEAHFDAQQAVGDRIVSLWRS